MQTSTGHFLSPQTVELIPVFHPDSAVHGWLPACTATSISPFLTRWRLSLGTPVNTLHEVGQCDAKVSTVLSGNRTLPAELQSMLPAQYPQELSLSAAMEPGIESNLTVKESEVTPWLANSSAQSSYPSRLVGLRCPALHVHMHSPPTTPEVPVKRLPEHSLVHPLQVAPEKPESQVQPHVSLLLKNPPFSHLVALVHSEP